MINTCASCEKNFKITREARIYGLSFYLEALDTASNTRKKVLLLAKEIFIGKLEIIACDRDFFCVIGRYS